MGPHGPHVCTHMAVCAKGQMREEGLAHVLRGSSMDGKAARDRSRSPTSQAQGDSREPAAEGWMTQEVSCGSATDGRSKGEVLLYKTLTRCPRSQRVFPEGETGFKPGAPGSKACVPKLVALLPRSPVQQADAGADAITTATRCQEPVCLP